MEELEKVIEAVMFALGREITVSELSETLCEDPTNIENALEEITKRYTKNDGVTLVKVQDAYQLVTNHKYYGQVNKFVENTKRQNLSTSALETLSIIAYNPKITKSEIESIRGVNSDFAVNRLLECGLVEEVARLNLPGRPAAYSVTTEFLKSCGIDDVTKLPKFEEIRIKDEQLLVSDFEESRDQDGI
ncbi:MAG: SMC-Scp complex subunit ScpB [Clostridia bacterium]|nr:SMC-Scp complex subunit ScpB [Clostridia bacterium]